HAGERHAASGVMMTIEACGRRLVARAVHSAQITDECLKRIDAENARLNAFILVMADEARRQAREADRELAAGHDRGALHGVPVSIKDLMDVRGTETTAASRVRAGVGARDDAPCIPNLPAPPPPLLPKTHPPASP